MKVIKQSHEIITMTKMPAEIIEIAGRTAYKSEENISEDSANAFVEKIIKRDHQAVLEHASMTVRFITDRGVSHELVRHRLCSFTQESTRYCDYSKDKFKKSLSFIEPHWWNTNYTTEEELFKQLAWLTAIGQCEENYFQMIKQGFSAQDARDVLINAIKTEIVVTANFREWRHIFQLRAIEKAAHPQMRALMIPLYNDMREVYPAIFNLGDVE